MRLRKSSFALILVSMSFGMSVGFADGSWSSDSPGLLHQLLITAAPAWAVEQALEWGADVNAPSNMWSGHNALHLAAEHGSLEHLALVAPRARDLNVAAGTGGTALTLAVEQDDWLERLQILLEAGADPNALDGRGHHPLALVASKASPGGVMPGEAITGVRLLLRYGADPNATLGNGATLLEEVLSFGPPVSLLDELLLAGLRTDPASARQDWEAIANANSSRLTPEVETWLRDINRNTATPSEGDGAGRLNLARSPWSGELRE